MEKKKMMIYGAIAALVLVVVWAVVTVPKPPTKEEAAKAAKKFMEYGEQTLNEEKDGKKIWDLTTKRAVTEMSTNNTEFFEIVGHFYTKDGKIITVTAPHGRYIDKTKNIYLDGKVKAVSSDGAVLTGEKLSWEAKKEILTAEGKAKLTKEELSAEGDKLEAYNNFEEFRATGHAHIIKGKAK